MHSGPDDCIKEFLYTASIRQDGVFLPFLCIAERVADYRVSSNIK